jgi:hypothetical protein
MSIHTHVLLVPNSRDAKDWFRFVNENLKHINTSGCLIVDFGLIGFLDTDEFVVLACLIESFYINGYTVEFRGGNKHLRRHFARTKFKEYWKEGFDRSRFTSSLNQTTLCLWKISKDMIYNYSSYAKKYFETFTDNKDLLPFSSNMDELFNNVFDHSKSSVTGYIITQYYPKKNRLSLSICDFGIGIPSSVQNAKIGTTNMNDWEAILHSLEMGVSAKSTPRNRGFGLNNVLEFTENTNGLLHIVSNNGVIKKKANNDYIRINSGYDFTGTLIKVEIELDKLDEKDETEESFDF